MSSRFLHVVTHATPALPFKAEKYSAACVDVLFICSSVGGHAGCFHLWATVNGAAVNVGGRISVQATAFKSVGRRPESGLQDHAVNSIGLFPMEPPLLLNISQWSPGPSPKSCECGSDIPHGLVLAQLSKSPPPPSKF